MTNIKISEELLVNYSQSSKDITVEERKAVIEYLSQRPDELNRVMLMTASSFGIGVESAPSRDELRFKSDRGYYTKDVEENELTLNRGFRSMYDDIKKEETASSISNIFSRGRSLVEPLRQTTRAALASLFDDSDIQKVAASRGEKRKLKK
ncbi:MAG: hypothetical protein IIV72_01385 [Alistipes sp.]|jgi:hypothetical protein|nr:hypothetical protein [Alistipes sp.]MBQ5692089.1 hypothetical protein [Alistipes sp.]